MSEISLFYLKCAICLILLLACVAAARPLVAAPLDTTVNAAAVRSDLRQEQRDASAASAPDPTVSTVQKADKKLEKSLSTVPVKSGLSPVMKEKIYPNGRRVTQVKGAAGTYCVTEEGVGATDGIDQMQQGRRKKVTNCGHLFDQ